MIEAMEIEDIDSLIAKYESQVDFSAIPKMATVEKKEEQQIEPKVQINSTSLKTNEMAVRKEVEVGQWEKLQALLYERSYELGSVFSQNVSFVSYNDGVLTWSSRAEGKSRELLTKYYSIIKHIIQDIYGIDTKIVVQKEQPKTKEVQKEQSAVMPAALPNADGEEVYKGFTPVDDDEEETEYVQQGYGLFDDEQETMGFEPETSKVKNLEDEAAELSLLKHPLVEKTKEIFGITDSNISVLQKL
jgi:DNA polymerase-3 subunit gamma/tau